MAHPPANLKSKARAHTDTAIRVLLEIMQDRSAPFSVRVTAATQILNRGMGALTDPTKFAPLVERFYVYSVHCPEGRLIYIGKGKGLRHVQSARRLNGRSRVRAEFDRERDALSFERRLIEKFNPCENIVYSANRALRTAH